MHMVYKNLSEDNVSSACDCQSKRDTETDMSIAWAVGARDTRVTRILIDIHAAVRSDVITWFLLISGWCRCHGLIDVRHFSRINFFLFGYARAFLSFFLYLLWRYEFSFLIRASNFNILYKQWTLAAIFCITRVKSIVYFDILLFFFKFFKPTKLNEKVLDLLV